MQVTLNNKGSGELYLQIMKTICGDTEGKSMVDLGCHTAPYTPQLGFKERTYVDIQDRGLDLKEEKHYFIKSDAVKFMRQGKIFDVSIASDFIEHLPVLKGRVLINLMERFSEKQIIFVPLGNHMVDEKTTHPDTHKSGWLPEYFEGWGKIIFPHFHPSLGVGAFFVFHCEETEGEFSRVKEDLKNIHGITY